jgi:hypothetical protein
LAVNRGDRQLTATSSVDFARHAKKIVGSRAVFIVGFERCMTTSLAAYLLHSKQCGLLVDGIKEPSVFASEPELAVKLIERETAARPGQWLLDASVDYIVNPDAMRLIATTVEDYRIIICLRNQLSRTFSAFAYYKALHTRRASPSLLYSYPYSLKFGDAATRARWANASPAPAFLRRQPPGRYGFTAINGSVRGLEEGDARLEEVDACVERFQNATLPSVIVQEYRHQRRTGQFPPLSILLFSHFAHGLEQALASFAPARVMLTTLDHPHSRANVRVQMEQFDGLTDLQPELPQSNSSGEFGGAVSKHDRMLAERLLADSFRSDSARVMQLANTPGLNVSLFSKDALYR